MTHDGYDHLRESADRQNGHFRTRPEYDTSSVVRMTQAERDAIDAQYPYTIGQLDEPMTFSDEGTLMPPKGYTEEWSAYEERVHRERMRQRILIVAGVGMLTLALIIIIAVTQ